MSDVTARLYTALADRYTIERELGSGGMATVYLARDIKHDRKVAVKVLRPDLAATLGPERFHREIKIAAQLQHPNILPLLDSGEADGFLYYVMPYVEGQSLGNAAFGPPYARAAGALPRPLAARVAPAWRGADRGPPAAARGGVRDGGAHVRSRRCAAGGHRRSLELRRDALGTLLSPRFAFVTEPQISDRILDHLRRTAPTPPRPPAPPRRWKPPPLLRQILRWHITVVRDPAGNLHSVALV